MHKLKCTLKKLDAPDKAHFILFDRIEISPELQKINFNNNKL